MRRLASWLLAAGLLLTTAQATAGLQLVLDRSGLDARQADASQALLDDAMAALPPRFVEQLDRRIDVSWSSRMPDNAYGQASLVSSLELNLNQLQGLADGSSAQRRTNRPHGTVREELLATVLHELTHIYDRARLWTPAERTLVSRCGRQDASLGKVGLPDECRGQTTRRFTLSDDPRLLDLAGWQQYVGRRGEREEQNRQIVRSPDIYEVSSPKEFVAVNMEYFLLDPTYACRRPALFEYFKARFDWAPARQQSCAQGLPYLNAGSDFAKTPLGKIDPERVYAVDYLLAEANQNLASRWGHSMLRLVICAPGRPRGPDCRLDLRTAPGVVLPRVRQRRAAFHLGRADGAIPLAPVRVAVVAGDRRIHQDRTAQPGFGAAEAGSAGDRIVGAPCGRNALELRRQLLLSVQQLCGGKPQAAAQWYA